MVTPQELAAFKKLYTELVEAGERFMKINTDMKVSHQHQIHELSDMVETDDELADLTKRANEFNQYIRR